MYIVVTFHIWLAIQIAKLFDDLKDNYSTNINYSLPSILGNLNALRKYRLETESYSIQKTWILQHFYIIHFIRRHVQNIRKDIAIKRIMQQTSIVIIIIKSAVFRHGIILYTFCYTYIMFVLWHIKHIHYFRPHIYYTLNLFYFVKLWHNQFSTLSQYKKCSNILSSNM